MASRTTQRATTTTKGVALKEPSTRLLIVTNSVDGSSDVLVRLAVADNFEVFRFNVDLWASYQWELNGEQCIFKDPTGRLFKFNADTAVLYRKPFLDSVNSENENIVQILKGQIRGLLHFIIALSSRSGNLRLVEPFADRRLPKLLQVIDAAAHFSVPRWEFVNQIAAPRWGPSITKPLTESQFSDGSIFYTSRCEIESLSNEIPWFVQSEITNCEDVTCVFIAGECWFYKSVGDRSKNGVDWRTTINSERELEWELMDSDSWKPIATSVVSLMSAWNLRYARIDFLIDSNRTVWFLECNSNGQFGWLDNPELTLHKAFLKATLDAGNAVLC